MPWCTQQSQTITVRPKFATRAVDSMSHHKSFVFPKKRKATLPSYFCSVKQSFGHQGNGHGTYRRKRTKFPSPSCQLWITRSNVISAPFGILRFRRAGRAKQHQNSFLKGKWRQKNATTWLRPVSPPGTQRSSSRKGRPPCRYRRRRAGHTQAARPPLPLRFPHGPAFRAALVPHRAGAAPAAQRASAPALTQRGGCRRISGPSRQRRFPSARFPRLTRTHRTRESRAEGRTARPGRPKDAHSPAEPSLVQGAAAAAYPSPAARARLLPAARPGPVPLSRRRSSAQLSAAVGGGAIFSARLPSQPGQSLPGALGVPSALLARRARFRRAGPNGARTWGHLGLPLLPAGRGLRLGRGRGASGRRRRRQRGWVAGRGAGATLVVAGRPPSRARRRQTERRAAGALRRRLEGPRGARPFPCWRKPRQKVIGCLLIWVRCRPERLRFQFSSWSRCLNPPCPRGEELSFGSDPVAAAWPPLTARELRAASERASAGLDQLLL